MTDFPISKNTAVIRHANFQVLKEVFASRIAENRILGNIVFVKFAFELKLS